MNTFFSRCKRLSFSRVFAGLFFLTFVLLGNLSSAQQTGVNTRTPHPSAAIDLQSVDKGILAPRLSTIQKEAVVNPAEGLVVYDTDLKAYTFFNGTQWVLPEVDFTFPDRAYAIVAYPRTESRTDGGVNNVETNLKFQPLTVSPASIVKESGDGILSLSGNRLIFNQAGRYLIRVSGDFFKIAPLYSANLKGRIIISREENTANLINTFFHLPSVSSARSSRVNVTVENMAAGDALYLLVKKDRFESADATEARAAWDQMLLEIELLPDP
ncbi:hypothetical protein ACFOET_16085 [Parapedobacter deserti]|uniref:Uncharacterized protein n=1 Tax=Parapedobacter deserti TaxID=1912957 RepID=A0ABV7JM34_9SPHI